MLGKTSPTKARSAAKIAKKVDIILMVINGCSVYEKSLISSCNKGINAVKATAMADKMVMSIVRFIMKGI
jgi:hypothetical protein